jgi:4-aminobutyrate aminotransferase-like enzyme
VVAAATARKAVLETNTRYLHEDMVHLAERLGATLPDPLEVCFFVNSGSEANELALRLARTCTGRRGVVVLDVGYHGNTTTLIDVSPYKHDGQGGAGPPPWVRKIPLPDPYRGIHRGEPDAGRTYAMHVHDAVAALRGVGEEPAALLAESILSCGGQVVPPSGFFAAAYANARAAGALCIADEVQTGLGRVGDAFWAFELEGVVPDIVTIGKPFGNGHPLAAVVTTRLVADAFANGMEYFNTFGGNTVSCAVGLAVLDVIEDEGLQRRAAATGAHLLAGLCGLMERHPLIGDVRGRGLFLGFELVEDRDARTPAPDAAAWLVERAHDRGVLLSTDGPDHNVIKIKPPLCFDAADADRLVGVVDDVLAEDFFRR